MDSLVIRNAGELLALETPQRVFFLEPLVHRKCLGMVFAPPGAGKTFFNLWIAGGIVAGQDFLKWRSRSRGRVLYVDGEMGRDMMQDRVAQLAPSGYDLEAEDFLISCPDDYRSGVAPAINTPEGQLLYEECIRERQVDVVIFDNYGCLTVRGSRDSDEAIWGQVAPWLIKLRGEGKAVILVHHAGKSGSQLGTSTKEQPLNWLIKLDPIRGDDPVSNRFWVRFEKPMRIRGASSQTFFAEFFDTRNGAVAWNWKTEKGYKRELVQRLVDKGLKKRDMAELLGMKGSEITQILTDIEENVEYEAIRSEKTGQPEEGTDNLF